MSPVRLTDMWDERRPERRKIRHRFMCPRLKPDGTMCGEVFTTQRALNKHKKKVHGD